MIRCTLCGATAPTATTAPQSAGWIQATINGPKAVRYLCACAEHTVADVAAWLKSAVVSVKGGK